METLNELRFRFGVAFKRFSTADAEMRRLRADYKSDDVCAWVHGINAQEQRLSAAESAYLAVRREYAERLLLLADSVEPGAAPIWPAAHDQDR